MLGSDLRRCADDHLDALGSEYLLVIHRTKTLVTAEADYVSRQVFVPSYMHSVVDYLAALHEMAHLVDPSADTRCGGDPLMVEAAAWGWALGRAKPELLEAMTNSDRRRMGLCWASHAGPVSM